MPFAGRLASEAGFVTEIVEHVLETSEVSIRRLNGLARDGVDGRHKRIVVYASATVSAAQLARMLHDAAGRIERTLPREAP
jgi:hypothetical protein